MHICKAAGACLGAVLGLVIGGLVGGGIGAGCIAGLIAGLVSLVIGKLCDNLFPSKPCYGKEPPPICDLVSLIVGTIAGCVGGAISGERILDGLVAVAGGFVGQIGWDACSIANS